jgi:hypothetical protein
MQVRTRITEAGVIQERVFGGEVSDFTTEVPSYTSTGEEVGSSIDFLSSSLNVVSSSVDTLRVDVDTLMSGGGGGGITIIPDAGTLNGTYSGNVLCEGSVLVSGNTTVKGDLTVVGIFNNTAGHQVTVLGDLRTLSSCDFTNLNPALPSAQITVRGSWHMAESIFFEQTGGVPGFIYVGGDLIGSSGGGPTASIEGSGQVDTSGLSLVVQGDLYMYQIDVRGGSSLAGPAGNGGNILVYGNLHTSRDVRCQGGQADGTGFSGGGGGNITVYGNFICDDDLRFNGGVGVGAGSNGGSGGYVEVYGDLIVDDEFDGYGGQSSAAAGGYGGNVRVYGDLIAQDPDLYGGNGATSGGAGGSLYCDGNVEVDSINAGGGNGADTTMGQGTGGWIDILGSLVCTNTINLSAGESSGVGAPCSTSAANGTCLNVRGNAYVNNVTIYGGTSNGAGAGGLGGNVEIGGDLNVKFDFAMVGGDAFASGNGANSGNLVVRGSLLGEGTVNLKGGDCGDGGSAGNSGNVTVTGDLKVASIIMQGGYCLGSTGGFSAGQGGSLLVKGFTASNAVTSAGGTVSNAGDTRGAPGEYITFEGGAACGSITFLDGTGVTGINPTTACSINLGGNCTFANINATSRSGIKIYAGENLPPAVVKVNAFTSKDTFNDRVSGVPSNGLSGLAADSLFLSNAVGSWYSVTGTSIFGP